MLVKIGKLSIVMIFIGLSLFIGYKSFYIVGKKIFPLKEEYIIREMSNKYEVDPYLISGIIYTESKFNKYAISNKGAKGYMQLMDTTAIWGQDEIKLDNFDIEKVYEAKYNIEIGTWYISKLIKQFGSVDVALASYNAGSGNVSKWLENVRYSTDKKTLKNIPFEETKNYVDKVKKIKEVYKILYKDYF